MTEKVTVRIGIRGVHSSENRGVVFSEAELIRFLRASFDISYNRAQNMAKNLRNGARSNASSHMVVVLTYKQLGKYTALRMQWDTPDTHYFIKYPYVTGLVKETDVVEDRNKPMELRPNFREIPKQTHY